MLRRTCVTALQRCTPRYSAAAVPKAALAAEKAPPAAQTPGMTTKTRGSGTSGDTVLDKAVLAAALGCVVTWWMTVSGPQHQH
ncbi:hypothetical protein Q4I30_006168 [Leishmania utingensis]|uniref:Uncharacterized protein n=1 Tax=Leishmania utingensis TaxID=653362 RepID=A0AAW3A9T7_9TRYP